MSGVLWALVSVLAVLVVLSVALLAMPIRLCLSLRTAPAWHLRLVVRLLGGLTPPIVVHDTARRQRKARRTKKTSTPSKTPTRKKAGRPRRARAARVATAAPRLVADMLRPVRLERLSIDADIGLDDPADTGHLFGLMAALTSSRPSAPNVSVAIRPDFTVHRVAADLDARLSVVPAELIPPWVRFAWLVFRARQ